MAFLRQEGRAPERFRIIEVAQQGSVTDTTRLEQVLLAASAERRSRGPSK